MAITIIQPLSWSSQLGGFDAVELAYNDANSATYKIGAVLTPNGTAGQLIEATAASPTTAIMGIALQPGSNLAAAIAYPNYGQVYPAGSALAGSSTAGTANAVTPLLCAVAAPNQVFEGTFITGATDTAITSAVVFTKFGLTKDATSGYWYVDGSKTTTNGSVTVIGIKNVQDITLGTTTGVRVFFVFNITETVFI